ncbi:hypothetical protein RND81_14G169600 [Saponaria officinalis]|uniref:Protein kinase domain-containing protein n=1 Tax=Saponaria officinalis TaxID=3572 RepID=A0AAW1GYT3_SAPOF
MSVDRGGFSHYLSNFEEYDEKALGAGGFGCVVRARNKLDNVTYAIKKVQLEVDFSGSFDEVVREVLIMARLDHPNLVRYYSSWLEAVSPGLVVIPDLYGGTEKKVDDYAIPMLFILQELCFGSLADILGPSLKDDKIWQIFKQLVEGLDYLHSKLVRHGDISPGNIFLDESKERVKYGDFGFSGEAGEDERTLPQGEYPPTTPYCAPELRNGSKYTLKSDVYSLGMVLMEMFAKFDDEDDEGFDRARAFDAYKKDGVLPPAIDELDETTRQLMTSMINVDSKERPSASSLLKMAPWEGKMVPEEGGEA